MVRGLLGVFGVWGSVASRVSWNSLLGSCLWCVLDETATVRLMGVGGGIRECVKSFWKKFAMRRDIQWKFDELN